MLFKSKLQQLRQYALQQVSMNGSLHLIFRAVAQNFIMIVHPCPAGDVVT